MLSWTQFPIFFAILSSELSFSSSPHVRNGYSSSSDHVYAPGSRRGIRNRACLFSFKKTFWRPHRTIFYIIAQNSLTWPHLATRNSGKCSLYMAALCHNKNRIIRNETRIAIEGQLAVTLSDTIFISGHSYYFPFFLPTEAEQSMALGSC